MKEKDVAILEKIAAQNQALENLLEKEKLILHQNEMLEQMVEERTFELKEEKKKSDHLLLNILPAETAEELKATGSAVVKHFDEVTVFFADFIGFAKISEKLTPTDLVHEINYCFSAFDKIVSKYGVEKIKTIGDAYMCAGGLPVANQTNAYDVLCAAIEIRDFMIQHKKDMDLIGEFTFELRIGMHTGPVVAGIVGIIKFAYDIWGNTVNIASRMESASEAGKINISETTYNKVKHLFNCEHRGLVNAKNFGELDMYFVLDEIKK
jgi:class 3 adenylate cyclase